MTKRELIDCILSLNASADAGFLAQFGEGELVEYLDALEVARAVNARSRRSSRAFAPPAMQAPRGQYVSESSGDPCAACPLHVAVPEAIPGQMKLFQSLA